MDELSIAWIPDIVAIVNMTSAMLANVAPVRNFLFIGYAIAVRTTGRHVPPPPTRAPTPPPPSPPPTPPTTPPTPTPRPTTTNSPMSPPPAPHNSHGLRTHA